MISWEQKQIYFQLGTKAFLSICKEPYMPMQMSIVCKNGENLIQIKYSIMHSPCGCSVFWNQTPYLEKQVIYSFIN